MRRGESTARECTPLRHVRLISPDLYLFISISICLSLYLFISLSLYLFISISLSPSPCLYLYLRLYLYLFSSIRYYYVFGFLFIVFVVLVVTCAEVAIVLCYFQLCGEDYRWWWRSFLAPGFSAVYIFVYCIIYYFQSLTHSTFVPTVLYFGYSFIASTVFFLVTGIVGFLACFWFTMAIYESIADKVD